MKDRLSSMLSSRFLVVRQDPTSTVSRTWLLKLWMFVFNQLDAREKKFFTGNEVVLNCVFVNEHQMKKLNGSYRGKHRATDILTFPAPHGGGDMVFCLSQIKKQARGYGHSWRLELAYLFIHGILHFLGYEHEGVAREHRDRMFSKQNHIMEKWLALKGGNKPTISSFHWEP
ncbi:MAG: rRNA maturation RNase YbeY [Bdellovibrionaceae bacterium]|nr:rRNA maturation RNase YbeY [Pseudobdellovibrionaceae bacterium]MDW8189674.1 rRNA maturation RNase YbeY [Pseudobdellovibrionaceae bacterium]